MQLGTTRWFLIAALVAALAIFGACGDDDGDGDGAGTETPSGETPDDGTPGELKTDFGVTDTEITLGMTLAKSGSGTAAAAAALFAPLEPAIQAYFRKVNQEDGGVCDRQIRLISEDDQYTPGPARERAGKLVEQDQVLAFLGNLGTAAVSGQVDYINDPNQEGDTSDGVPHLFLSTGAHKWGDVEKYPWTIGYIPDYVAEGTVIATYLNEADLGETAAILYQNDDFGKDGRRGFTETFAGTIVAEQSYAAGAPDIAQQLATLRAEDPDILFLYSLPLQTNQAITYMTSNNWKPQVAWSYVNPNTLMAQLQGGVENIVGTISTNYLLDPVADAEHPAMVEHARIMQEYQGGDVAQLTVYGQSLAEVMVETLRIACENGDMTRAGVMKAAESIQGYRSSVLYEGIEINLSDNDHIALEALVPVEIQADNTLKPLSDVINVEDIE